MDLLQKLHAVVDIGNKLLVTPSVKIPIIINESTTPQKQFKNCNHVIVIPPRTEQIVKIPVCYKEGIGILNFTKFGTNVESPESVVNIKDYFAYVALTNSGINSCKITITEPFDIELLNTNEVNFCNQLENNKELSKMHDNMLKENLKNLQFEHLNSEEKEAIKKFVLNTEIYFTAKIFHLVFLTKLLIR